MPRDLNIKLYILLLPKPGESCNATFEALVAGRARICKAQTIPPKPASRAPALGSGGLGEWGVMTGDRKAQGSAGVEPRGRAMPRDDRRAVGVGGRRV